MGPGRVEDLAATPGNDQIVAFRATQPKLRNLADRGPGSPWGRLILNDGASNNESGHIRCAMNAPSPQESVRRHPPCGPISVGETMGMETMV
jgi:hypothetical protein